MHFLVLAVAVTCGIFDFFEGIVPNYITFPFIVFGLIFQTLSGNSILALAGLSLGFAIGFICWILGGMGGGDLKLITGLGAWLGVEWLIYTLTFGSIIGVIWGIIKMIKNGYLKKWVYTFLVPLSPKTFAVKKEKNIVPYGTCLALGYFVLLFKGGLMI